MSQAEPKEPYVYQPYSVQNKYGVAWVSIARIDGLTKIEAQAVLAALKATRPDPTAAAIPELQERKEA
jgi:hypothetical protein